MKSKKSLLIGLVVGALLGMTVATVTPAGASMATNWSRVWKKYLKPKADKRYYTKTLTDQKVAAAQAAATAAGAQQGAAAANTATDDKLISYYKKSESDAKYAPAGAIQRGSFLMNDYATAAGEYAGTTVDWGFTLAIAPTVHLIQPSAAVPAGCSGSIAAPGASPGHLCVFFAPAANVAGFYTCGTTAGSCVPPEKFGLSLYIKSAAAGRYQAVGTWALNPGGAAGVSNGRVAVSPRSTGAGIAPAGR